MGTHRYRGQIERCDAGGRVDHPIGTGRLEEDILAAAENPGGYAFADFDLVEPRQPGYPVADGVDMSALRTWFQLAVVAGKEHRTSLGADRTHGGREDAVHQLARIEVRRQRVHQGVGGLQQFLGPRRWRCRHAAGRLDDRLEKNRLSHRGRLDTGAQRKNQ